MSRRRVATLALCGTAVLGGWVAGAHLGFGFRAIETDETLIAGSRATSGMADSAPTEAPQATALIESVGPGVDAAIVAATSHATRSVKVASAVLMLPLPDARPPRVAPASPVVQSQPPRMQVAAAGAMPAPEAPRRPVTAASPAVMPEPQTLEHASASPVPPAAPRAQIAAAPPMPFPQPQTFEGASANPMPAAETAPEHVGSASATPPLESRALGALYRLASVDPTDPAPDVKPRAKLEETPNECLVASICIDEYLWSLYQRAPKIDTAKLQEKIKVKVKRKGKLRTVTQTTTKYVVQDFGWKDPIAAQRAGMSLTDYVIGGMDRRFKTKLYQALRMMDEAGLEPGITSAFRDDYRQAIATGNKASSDSSYHGGSLRGGYGHGLAVDLVSVKGDTRMQRFASSEMLWKWIDAHEKELGVGRPYLDRDPPHIGPLNGKEYADKRARAEARRAATEKKQRAAALAKNKRHPAAVRNDPGKTKRANDDPAKAKRATSDHGKAKAKTASSKARSI